MFFCVRVMSRWCKDTKDNSELEKLPGGDMSDKGVISSDSGSEKPASHVGVDLTLGLNNLILYVVFYRLRRFEFVLTGDGL